MTETKVTKKWLDSALKKAEAEIAGELTHHDSHIANICMNDAQGLALVEEYKKQHSSLNDIAKLAEIMPSSKMKDETIVLALISHDYSSVNIKSIHPSLRINPKIALPIMNLATEVAFGSFVQVVQEIGVEAALDEDIFAKLEEEANAYRQLALRGDIIGYADTVDCLTVESTLLDVFNNIVIHEGNEVENILLEIMPDGKNKSTIKMDATIDEAPSSSCTAS